jgi:hypothetical protein
MEIRKGNACPAEIQKSVPERRETVNKVITNRLVFRGPNILVEIHNLKKIYASEILQFDYIQA